MATLSENKHFSSKEVDVDKYSKTMVDKNNTGLTESVSSVH